MRIVRNRPPTGPLSTGSAVTIGNFDGVHRGHRALIERCREHAGGRRDVAVVTFEPLPIAHFRPHEAPARLSSPAGRLRQLDHAGADIAWVLRFDEALARVAPEAFAEQVLAESLVARTVVVGEDFRFGHRRAGDVATLRRLGEALGFDVDTVEAVCVDGQRVSSTRIREALAAGDMTRAEALLGRPFTMSGRVRRGDGRGRDFGYPTANLPVRQHPCPVHGVFAVRARVEGGPWRDGVASVGTRPTVGGRDWVLEVHLFGVDENLYGRRMQVAFVEKLRDEHRFDDVETMVRQMHDDAAAARAALKTTETTTGKLGK